MPAVACTLALFALVGLSAFYLSLIAAFIDAVFGGDK
jgi:hypothetical protein